MSVLIFAHHQNNLISDQTRRILTAATQLGSSVDLLLIGKNMASMAESARSLFSIKNVIVADNDVFEHLLAEPVSEFLTNFIKNHNYNYLISPATTQSKNIFPRVAAQLNKIQISDVTQIIDPNTFTRPIYAGNAFETVFVNDNLKILTIRSTHFNLCTSQKEKAPVKNITVSIQNTPSKFIQSIQEKNTYPNLDTAKIIVSGGRGFETPENFQSLLIPLAKKLNAAIGASRAAVDAGFAPNEFQIGQTGRVVAPDIYFAIGISGAIQHLAGMKDSQIIIALNKDPEAPIFKISDYGLVGDLFDILPQLEKKLT